MQVIIPKELVSFECGESFYFCLDHENANSFVKAAKMEVVKMANGYEFKQVYLAD